MNHKLIDAAIVQAKKMDHGTVLPVHVLTAVLNLKRRRGDDVGWLIKNTSRLLEQTVSPPSRHQPEISQRAEYWLGRASEWMPDMELKSLQAECEGRSSLTDGAEAPIAKARSESEASPSRELHEILAELDALIGLREVKAKVRQFIADQAANKVRAEAGKPTLPTSLNLVFSGPPGTGKTTVARIMAEVYKALGLLKKGHLVETGRAELVGQFIGQTALKTLEVAAEALDGVLFIDEAYTLAPASPNDYGGEAIATLIQFMENNRGRIAVIAAGYTQEMTEFISQNPGLRSRFANFIEFHPYTPEEMLSIFRGLSVSMELMLADEVADALLARFQAVDYANELGNGRYARELFAQMCSALNARAYREQTLDLDSLSSFSVADIPERENKFLNSRSIGFTQ